MLKYFHGQRRYLSLFSLAQWEDTLICCYPTTLPAAQLGGLRDVCVPFVYPQPAAVSSDFITDGHSHFLSLVHDFAHPQGNAKKWSEWVRCPTLQNFMRTSQFLHLVCNIFTSGTRLSAFSSHGSGPHFFIIANAVRTSSALSITSRL